MKTAISLPDELFELGEAAARRLSVSRSQLYAAALEEYLERRRTESVTKRLNEIYSNQPSRLDPALHRAQLKSVDRDSW